MTDRKLVVISAGLSSPSSTRMLADRLTAASLSELSSLGEKAAASTVELRDHAHAVTNNLLTGFAEKELEAVLEQVYDADALIVVTPIFSTSYSGLFKSFVDILDRDALRGKPVILAANAGTARHSLAIDYALRPLFAYLHTEPVSTGVFAASSDWGDQADKVAPLQKRIAAAAAELALAIARKPKAERVDPFDPESYLDGGSFGELLQGLGH